MKKALPKIKKNLKSFILDEDAKIIDKTATKIAITASFMAASVLFSSQDAHAKGHKNHSNHSNYVYDKTNGLQNNMENESIQETFKAQGKTLEVEVAPKAVAAAHGNHYNHADGGGSS